MNLRAHCQRLALPGGWTGAVLATALLGQGGVMAQALPSAAAPVAPVVVAPAVVAPAVAVPAKPTAAMPPAASTPPATAAQPVVAPKRPGRWDTATNASRAKVPPGSTAMVIPEGSAVEVELGRRIYLDGMGAAGKPIVGVRFGGVEANGMAVACVTCHRRSGLGSVEGTDQVNPVAGRFLFSDDARAITTMNFRNVKSFNKQHQPLDLKTLGEAIRTGQHVSGRELSPIMPRYDFTEAEIRGLAAYLRTLSLDWSPGVAGLRIRFATVITPGVDGERRKAFLDTIKGALAQKNGSTVPGQRTMSAAEMVLNTQRWWDLDVWELEGAPETWAGQLNARYQAQPVFALISGLGDGTWAPVHQFCEGQKVPCLFPSVDLPSDPAADDFYSIYFSRGVKLEAEVLAKHLLATKQRPKRVIQVHAGDEAGRGAAAVLKAALAGFKPAIKVEERIINATDPASLKQALAKLGSKDAVMFWLRPAEIKALGELAPPADDVYFSAYLANGEHLPLAGPWKARVRLVYPFQLPEMRGTGLMYFHAWLKIRKLALVDEVMQSEVYFTMSYLAETIMEMLDNLHRDYLIERTESMLSQRESAKAEDESREMTIAKHQVIGGTKAALERNAKLIERNVTPRPIPGHAPHSMAKRESTTIYPRLGLAQGQRFASKGGYIVRFAEPESDKLTAVTDWIVP